MTSKIVVNNIEADAGVSTVTFNSNVERGSSNLHSTGLNVNNTFVHSTGIALGAGSTIGAVTGVTTYFGDGSQLTGISAGVSLANGADNRVVTATGAAALNGEAKITSDGNNLTVNRTDGSNRGFVVTHGGTEVARLSNHGTGAEGKLELKNSGTTKISLNGYNGTLQLHGTAGYIIFGDTDTAAHRLDDYEEGNFVPYPVNGWGILNGGATSGGSNAAVALGKYIKIGSLCYIFFTYKEGNSSGASFNGNRLQFYGLPFQSEGQFPTSGDQLAHPIFGFGGNCASNAENLICRPDAGSSTIAGLYVSTSGGYGDFTGSNLGNNGQVWFSGCYKVHP